MRTNVYCLRGLLILCGVICLVGCHSEFEKLEKNAEQGDAAAQMKLGTQYYQGDGVEKDLQKAVKWFQKAADQGNAEGLYHIGKCYLAGEGVSQDTRKALESLEKAGELGQQEALSILCGLYYEGNHTIPPSEKSALAWCQNASEHGDTASQEKVNILTERITQREEAERARQEAERIRQEAIRTCLLNCDATHSPCERVAVWCLLFEGELDTDTAEYLETQDYLECLNDMKCMNYKAEWQTCSMQCQQL